MLDPDQWRTEPGPPPGDFGMKTCLIVEDSALIREIAARIAKGLGLKPVEAASAAEAVEIARTARPDIALLDWDLPTLGALDFLRGVGEFAPEARFPIVLCATEHDHQQFTLARAAGAAFHIMKPFDIRTVGEKFVEAGVIARDAVPAPQPPAPPVDIDAPFEDDGPAQDRAAS